MPDKDTKTDGLNAKITGLIAQEFNEDNRLGAAIANASPEAQQEIQKQIRLAERVLEDKIKWQRETRGDRLTKERTRMLERYMNDPAPRPNTAEARQNDMKIIEEQAERKITERDDFSLENTKREAKSYVYQILRNDRQQAQEQSQDYDHSQGY